MPNRMLRDWTVSDKMNSISVHVERFFVRLIMRVDDHGCFTADSRLLKANLFPLLLDSIREADLIRWTAECEKADLIVLYECEGKKYLQIKDFRQRLDKANSKYPLPNLIENQTVNEEHRTVNDSVPEVEVEVEIESPNGLGGKPPIETHYSKIEKTKEAVYRFIKTQKPNYLQPYFDFWNLFANEKGFPVLKSISETRKKKIKVRTRDASFDFIEIVRKAGKSDLLRESQWFSFDWVIENDRNYIKVLEGNYDNGQKQLAKENIEEKQARETMKQLDY